MVSTVEAVADTAGSGLSVGAVLALALSGGVVSPPADGLAVLVPAAVVPVAVVVGAGAAVQAVIMTAAAIISDHPAKRTLVVTA
ncbi:hypothetical protein [Paenarthrobacter nitroguajacolicus]|uniref:hypothetical protein n=1 Tax=Paenarthrobacter nitroguajacolicus TaxID=211146 RepID=UPI00248C3357|nr:hypothetical protein [Paenarthrobacter nitroguajacolicus]